MTIYVDDKEVRYEGSAWESESPGIGQKDDFHWISRPILRRPLQRFGVTNAKPAVAIPADSSIKLNESMASNTVGEFPTRSVVHTSWNRSLVRKLTISDKPK